MVLPLFPPPLFLFFPTAMENPGTLFSPLLFFSFPPAWRVQRDRRGTGKPCHAALPLLFSLLLSPPRPAERLKLVHSSLPSFFFFSSLFHFPLRHGTAPRDKQGADRASGTATSSSSLFSFFFSFSFPLAFGQKKNENQLCLSTD